MTQENQDSSTEQDLHNLQEKWECVQAKVAEKKVSAAFKKTTKQNTQAAIDTMKEMVHSCSFRSDHKDVNCGDVSANVVISCWGGCLGQVWESKWNIMLRLWSVSYVSAYYGLSHTLAWFGPEMFLTQI